MAYSNAVATDFDRPFKLVRGGAVGPVGVTLCYGMKSDQFTGMSELPVVIEFMQRNGIPMEFGVPAVKQSDFERQQYLDSWDVPKPNMDAGEYLQCWTDIGGKLLPFEAQPFSLGLSEMDLTKSAGRPWECLKGDVVNRFESPEECIIWFQEHRDQITGLFQRFTKNELRACEDGIPKKPHSISGSEIGCLLLQHSYCGAFNDQLYELGRKGETWFAAGMSFYGGGWHKLAQYLHYDEDGDWISLDFRTNNETHDSEFDRAYRRFLSQFFVGASPEQWAEADRVWRFDSEGNVVLPTGEVLPSWVLNSGSLNTTLRNTFQCVAKFLKIMRIIDIDLTRLYVKVGGDDVLAHAVGTCGLSPEYIIRVARALFMDIKCSVSSSIEAAEFCSHKFIFRKNHYCCYPNKVNRVYASLAHVSKKLTDAQLLSRFLAQLIRLAPEPSEYMKLQDLTRCFVDTVSVIDRSVEFNVFLNYTKQTAEYWLYRVHLPVFEGSCDASDLGPIKDFLWEELGFRFFPEFRREQQSMPKKGKKKGNKPQVKTVVKVVRAKKSTKKQTKKAIAKKNWGIGVNLSRVPPASFRANRMGADTIICEGVELVKTLEIETSLGSVYAFLLNPSNSVFPRLKGISSSYEQFCFKNFRLHYIPSCPTTQEGVFFAAHLEDPDDTLPGSPEEARAYAVSTAGSVGRPQSTVWDSEIQQKLWFVNPQDPEADTTTAYQGQVCFAAFGASTAGAIGGFLLVEYRCELHGLRPTRNVSLVMSTHTQSTAMAAGARTPLPWLSSLVDFGDWGWTNDQNIEQGGSRIKSTEFWLEAGDYIADWLFDVVVGGSSQTQWLAPDEVYTLTKSGKIKICTGPKGRYVHTEKKHDQYADCEVRCTCGRPGFVYHVFGENLFDGPIETHSPKTGFEFKAYLSTADEKTNAWSSSWTQSGNDCIAIAGNEIVVPTSDWYHIDGSNYDSTATIRFADATGQTSGFPPHFTLSKLEPTSIAVQSKRGLLCAPNKRCRSTRGLAFRETKG